MYVEWEIESKVHAVRGVRAGGGVHHGGHGGHGEGNTDDCLTEQGWKSAFRRIAMKRVKGLLVVVGVLAAYGLYLWAWKLAGVATPY